MSANTKKVPKKEVIFESGNFTVSAYDFIIPNGERAGTKLGLIELKVMRRMWSDEAAAYYKQSQYITISQEQLVELIDNTKII